MNICDGVLQNTSRVITKIEFEKRNRMNETYKSVDSIMTWKQYSAPSLFSAPFIELYDWILFIPAESAFVINILNRKHLYVRSQEVTGNYRGKRISGYAVAVRSN